MSNYELKSFYGYLISSGQHSKLSATTYLYVVRKFKDFLKDKELKDTEEKDCIDFFNAKATEGQT